MTGSGAVRCSPRCEEIRRFLAAIDTSLRERGGPSRTVAPGVSGSSPLGRPTKAPLATGGFVAFVLTRRVKLRSSAHAVAPPPHDGGDWRENVWMIASANLRPAATPRVEPRRHR